MVWDSITSQSNEKLKVLKLSFFTIRLKIKDKLFDLASISQQFPNIREFHYHAYGDGQYEEAIYAPGLLSKLDVFLCPCVLFVNKEEFSKDHELFGKGKECDCANL
jgi:hypothetical protein